MLDLIGLVLTVLQPLNQDLSVKISITRFFKKIKTAVYYLPASLPLLPPVSWTVLTLPVLWIAAKPHLSCREDEPEYLDVPVF